MSVCSKEKQAGPEYQGKCGILPNPVIRSSLLPDAPIRKYFYRSKFRINYGETDLIVYINSHLDKNPGSKIYIA